MKKLFLSLAFAASALSLASFQANGSNSTMPDASATRHTRSCKVLVQRMDASPSANTWRNRIRTWKCRNDLSPDTAETTAILRELNDERP